MIKLQNIQALRGIAVLSVVLFHLVVIEKKYGGDEYHPPGLAAIRHVRRGPFLRNQRVCDGHSDPREVP